MNADNIEIEIKFIGQGIQLEELALIESVMPDIILAMMQEDELDND